VSNTCSFFALLHCCILLRILAQYRLWRLIAELRIARRGFGGVKVELAS